MYIKKFLYLSNIYAHVIAPQLNHALIDMFSRAIDIVQALRIRAVLQQASGASEERGAEAGVVQISVEALFKNFQVLAT